MYLPTFSDFLKVHGKHFTINDLMMMDPICIHIYPLRVGPLLKTQQCNCLIMIIIILNVYIYILYIYIYKFPDSHTFRNFECNS